VGYPSTPIINHLEKFMSIDWSKNTCISEPKRWLKREKRRR